MFEADDIVHGFFPFKVEVIAGDPSLGPCRGGLLVFLLIMILRELPFYDDSIRASPH